jgi:hypothetical protein
LNGNTCRIRIWGRKVEVHFSWKRNTHRRNGKYEYTAVVMMGDRFLFWLSMEKSHSEKKSDDSTDDRRLQIARLIAAKTFQINKAKDVPQDKSNGKNRRGVGTNEIIRNSEYQNLYTMEIEREYMTSYHFTNIIQEMKKMSQYSTVSTKSLIRTLRNGLKVRSRNKERNGIKPLCHSFKLISSSFFSRLPCLDVKSISGLVQMPAHPR